MTERDDRARLQQPYSAEDELFLHHPVPLWVYDRTTLRFIAVNDAAIIQYGYTRDQFLSMRVVDIRVDADDDTVRQLLANPGRRRRWRSSGVVKHRCADGRILHTEITSQDLTFRDTPAVAVTAYDVTDRIHAEAAARDAERRLSEAQSLAGLGSWQSMNAATAPTWSAELFHIAGLSPDDGAPPWDRQRSLYPEKEWERLSTAVAHARRTGEPFELQSEVLRPDGTTRWIIARGAALRDAAGQVVGLHGTVQDVTERRRQEEALQAAYERLRESEVRYRELVESLDDVVFSVDTSGTLLFTSNAVEHYGYGPTELVGRSFLSVVHPDDRAAAEASFVETVAGNRQKREFRVIDKAGRTHHVRSSNRVLVRNGQPVAVSGVLVDLTEQWRAQEQLRTAGRLEAVGRLAGGVAHDFNNLLVAINGFAEMALAEAPDGSQLKEDLGEIVKAGNRAAALTSQLLTFSRKQVLRPDSVDLNDIVTSMEPMLRRLIGEDIEMQITCGADVPHVRIDPGHLEQVVMNLVVNARDAMPQGGVLRISTGRTGFPEAELPAGHTSDDVAILTVSDTGAGMDDTVQAQIFEPFFTTKPLGQGTGLGLAMVYGFVKQSGGAIAVQSAPGEGATFRIALPRQEGSRTLRAAQERAMEDGSETILVAEDEETVRTLIRRLLTGAGYHVLTADSPDEALQICRGYRGQIDLLLTDVVMPQMSGPALASRATALRPEMNVLFMSGYAGADIVARGLDGSSHLLQKPFNAVTLSDAVRAALAVAR